ncbi:aldose 1-epimerase family protein [uncultured Paraglaciecola sp.]|uniref:aldose 1-epimerase family protein n=1 Tax=uncultured Paraglaciecola sp. TaxID=1765024 RepID=UPI0030DC3847|tara:strand:- start:232792 stop:233664 length:873 start_codon:yes stop_codon:yes gene_type:complete
MHKQTHKIANAFLSCTISEVGAEIISLRSLASNREYMWQADPTVWDESAPILFPIVGRLNTGQYAVDGQKYSLPTHGFAKRQRFIVKQQTESTIRLTMSANSSTLASFPYQFQLDVTFSLEQKALEVKYEIINQDDTALYFAIGSHPGFALPQSDFNQQKCKLIFSDQESPLCRLIKNDLLTEQNYPVQFSGKTLPITPDTFEKDALIFRDLCSSSIILSVDDTPILSLEMGNNQHLGLWAKPKAAYVCIEPWTATDETENTPLEISDKPDLACLLSGEMYTNDYRINIF